MSEIRPSRPVPRRLAAALALAGALAAAGAVGVSAQEPRFIDTVRRSGFIFIGTVEAIGKATESIPVRPDGAVVRVDRVLEALPPVGDPTGQTVTVRLRDPRSVTEGTRAAFFTYVQSAGATLELIEVAREEPRADELEGRIAGARRELADRALSERLESAVAVVVGEVTATGPADEAGRPDSEHDPLWWWATFAVERVEAGRLATNERETRVYFATNYDYRWADAPRLEKGERAILLLQPDPDREDRVTGLFILDPLDKLPPSELDRVRGLIARQR